MAGDIRDLSGIYIEMGDVVWRQQHRPLSVITNSDYFFRLPFNNERDTRCLVAGSRQVGCVLLSLGRLSSCGMSTHILQCPLAKTLSFLEISVLRLGGGREGTGVPRKPPVSKALTRTASQSTLL